MKRILILGLLIIPLTGCTFVDKVKDNDVMGSFIGVTLDDENEMEKMEDGNSELQKTAKEYQKKSEERKAKKKAEKASEIEKEENKPKEEQSGFTIRWK